MRVMKRLDQAEKEHMRQLVKDAISLKEKADELQSRAEKLNDKAKSLRKLIASRQRKKTN